ncbi:phosphotransferase [Limnohabitans sp. TEGF004]|uniref:aminoglycoside phosphotransferase family protein n=1 Tax=Limnohabitans sp. TEGF004 TaxID=2986281 RepID=UPI0023770C21|nr:phosphotransferase [Limnohabitans sp. TEGF004]BDU56843.1 aminoglycoside phosphotransferase [Limnohabitans sp. TEGF004]
MSTQPNSQPSGANTSASIEWAQPERQAAFHQWLNAQASAHGVLPATVRAASADASFRRYFRVDTANGSCIVMDAPPDKENCEPFVRIARLMLDAGLYAPRILAWDEPQGFMLLDDIGSQTMMDVINRDDPQANHGLYMRAVDALLTLQQSSRPSVLPAYDEALLQRELSLFPDWYLTQHRQLQIDSAQREMLDKTFKTIIQRNLAAPSVYVHRDFMPRNFMMPHDPTEQRLGVLDFQDAVYGPITYDIASLMRDAFLTWEEDVVLDVTIRYWERARKIGLLDFEDWHNDFGAFYRAVEWMGLQRHLKVAGIFARLTLRDGKPKYLADAPRFINYIRTTASRYSDLTPLLRLIDKIEGTEPAISLAFPRLTPGGRG